MPLEGHGSCHVKPLKVGSKLRWKSFEREPELDPVIGKGRKKAGGREGCSQTLLCSLPSRSIIHLFELLFGTIFQCCNLFHGVVSSGISPGVPTSLTEGWHGGKVHTPTQTQASSGGGG